MRRMGWLVLGGLTAAIAFLLLADPASAQPEDLAAHKAERKAEMQADAAERQAEIAARIQAEKAEIEAEKAEIEARKAQRQAELAAERAATQARAETPRSEPAAKADLPHPAKDEPQVCTCDPVTNSGVYTLDADFDKGDANNVVHTPSDQLQLAEQAGDLPVPVGGRLLQGGRCATLRTHRQPPEGHDSTPIRGPARSWGSTGRRRPDSLRTPPGPRSISGAMCGPRTGTETAWCASGWSRTTSAGARTHPPGWATSGPGPWPAEVSPAPRTTASSNTCP